MDEALRYAVRLLARRDHSISDLTARLEARFSVEVADATIGVLRSKRLLDDRRLAEHFVEVHRSRGPKRLLGDLVRRGIDARLAEDVLEQVKWPSLGEALETRMDRLKLAPPLTDRDAGRLFRWLHRQGYDAEEIRDELERFS